MFLRARGAGASPRAAARARGLVPVARGLVPSSRELVLRIRFDLVAIGTSCLYATGSVSVRGGIRNGMVTARRFHSPVLRCGADCGAGAGVLLIHERRGGRGGAEDAERRCFSASSASPASSAHFQERHG